MHNNFVACSVTLQHTGDVWVVQLWKLMSSFHVLVSVMLSAHRDVKALCKRRVPEVCCEGLSWKCVLFKKESKWEICIPFNRNCDISMFIILSSSNTHIWHKKYTISNSMLLARFISSVSGAAQPHQHGTMAVGRQFGLCVHANSITWRFVYKVQVLRPFCCAPHQTNFVGGFRNSNLAS